MTWHADPDLLERYADGRIDDVAASSLEAHLVACAACRDGISAHAPAARLGANWNAVTAALDAPAPGPLERLLTRAGLRAGTARLLAATPTLRASWLASVALAVAFAAVAASRPGGAPLLFLALAPLVPVVAVAVAFSRALDPSSEVVEATPLAGMRLLLLRTVASLAPSVLLAAAASLAVDDVGRSSAMWLLPALALSALSLLASSVVPVGAAAGVLGGLWSTGVVAAEAAARGSLSAVRRGGDLESLLVQLPAQVLAAAVALVAAALVARRTLHAGEHHGRYA